MAMAIGHTLHTQPTRIYIILTTRTTAMVTAIITMATAVIREETAVAEVVVEAVAEVAVAEVAVADAEEVEKTSNLLPTLRVGGVITA